MEPVWLRKPQSERGEGLSVRTEAEPAGDRCGGVGVGRPQGLCKTSVSMIAQAVAPGSADQRAWRVRLTAELTLPMLTPAGGQALGKEPRRRPGEEARRRSSQMHLLCAGLQRVGPSSWNCSHKLKIHCTHRTPSLWVSSICVSCLKHREM